MSTSTLRLWTVLTLQEVDASQEVEEAFHQATLPLQ